MQDAEIAGEFGNSLNIACVNHGNLAEVKLPEDFKTHAPAGRGCQCGVLLSFGRILFIYWFKRLYDNN